MGIDIASTPAFGQTLPGSSLMPPADEGVGLRSEIRPGINGSLPPGRALLLACNGSGNSTSQLPPEWKAPLAELSRKVDESARGTSWKGYPSGEITVGGKNYHYEATRLRCGSPEGGVPLQITVYPVAADGKTGDGVAAAIDGYEKTVELPSPTSGAVLKAALAAALAQYQH